MLIKFIFHLVLGFCESEQSNFDSVWPETEAGQTVSLPCDVGIVTRMCSRNDNGAEWLAPNISQCDTGELIHGYCHTLRVARSTIQYNLLDVGLFLRLWSRIL